MTEESEKQDQPDPRLAELLGEEPAKNASFAEGDSFLDELEINFEKAKVADIYQPPFQRVAAERGHRLRKRLPFRQVLAPPVDLYHERCTGRYISLNGAGRQWLANHSKIEMIDARIFRVPEGQGDLSDEQQQVLLEKLNTEVDTYSKNSLFQSRLQAGVETEVRIAEILRLVHLPWNEKKSPGVFSSAHTLYTMWSDGESVPALGPDHLIARAATVMIKGYGKQGDANNPQVMAGIGKILRANAEREVSLELLARLLQESGTAKQLLTISNDNRNGNGAGPKVGNHLIKLYNKEARANGVPRLNLITTARPAPSNRVGKE